MNVFIPYPDTFETAKCLDSKRLQKQILEVTQMVSAIEGLSKAYRLHPCTLMYENYVQWLEWYRDTLWVYKNACGLYPSNEPERPPFIGDENLHRAHRARLYQKNPIHYAEFESDKNYTDKNWYIVDGYLLKYKDGKLVEKSEYKNK